MPAPILPLLLLIAGGGALAAAASKNKPGASPASGTHILDANLPPDLTNQVLGALSTSTDPNALLFLASQMDAQGFHLTAAALRTRAAELAALQPMAPVPQTQAPPSPAPIPIPVIPTPGPAASAAIPVTPAPSPADGASPVTPAVTAPPMDPGASGLDATMDPQTRAAIMQALATETDPAKLAGFASAIQLKFPIGAGLLMTKAAAMQSMQPVGPVIPLPQLSPPPPGAAQTTPAALPTNVALDPVQLAPGKSIRGLMSADQWRGVLTLLNEWLEDNHADPAISFVNLGFYRDNPDDLQDQANFELTVDALQSHANQKGYSIPPNLPGNMTGVLDGQTFATLLGYAAVHGHAIPTVLVPSAHAIQSALGGVALGASSAATPKLLPGPAPAPMVAPLQLTMAAAPPVVAPALDTIQAVQHALNLLGASPPLKEDGIGGPKTTAAIKAFQSAHPPLAADGVAGPQTKSALQHAIAGVGGQLQTPPPAQAGTQIAPQIPALAKILGVAPPPQAPAITSIADVQHALNMLGASPPLKEDGIDGPKTQASVRTFQQAHPPLTVDGKAGPQTRAALAQAMAMPALVAAKPISVDSVVVPTQVLGPSATPQAVTNKAALSSTAIATTRDVQHALNVLGASPPLTEDGVNGPKTQAAVRAFQQAHPPLAVDGNAGPQTRAALAQAVAVPAAVAASPVATVKYLPAPAAAASPTPLAASSKSTATPIAIATTQDVQHALNLLGTNPPLKEDGIGGPKTQAAVKAFQTAHGLTADGVAGPHTKAALVDALGAITHAAAGTATQWRIARNSDVLRDGVAGRFGEMLSHPEGALTECEVHNGRKWCFQVVSHRTHPHLTTHAKDVVAYVMEPRLAATGS